MTSRLDIGYDTHFLHTRQVGVYERIPGISTRLLADGATLSVVQKQLQHSDPHTTLGIYGHVIGNQQRDAIEKRSARIEQFAEN